MDAQIRYEKGHINVNLYSYSISCKRELYYMACMILVAITVRCVYTDMFVDRVCVNQREFKRTV
jgi:hypothetical protein